MGAVDLQRRYEFLQLRSLFSFFLFIIVDVLASVIGSRERPSGGVLRLEPNASSHQVPRNTRMITTTTKMFNESKAASGLRGSICVRGEPRPVSYSCLPHRASLSREWNCRRAGLAGGDRFGTVSARRAPLFFFAPTVPFLLMFLAAPGTVFPGGKSNRTKKREKLN